MYRSCTELPSFLLFFIAGQFKGMERENNQLQGELNIMKINPPKTNAQLNSSVPSH